MARQKGRLTAKQNTEKAHQRQECMWIFMGGKLLNREEVLN